MITTHKFRLGFSMLELVFVITILGIVASISSSVIVQVFQSYVPQKASATASQKTEVASEQIANRLAAAVPWSLIAKDSAGNHRELTNITVADASAEKFPILEWIGEDIDGFSTGAWSGYCNTATSTATSCTTTNSSLGMATGIIERLSQDSAGASQVSLGAAANKRPVVIFKTNDNKFGNPAVPNDTYSPSCMGMTLANDTTCTIKATSTVNDVLTMPAGAKLISEQYVLAWSAYALVPENCVDRNGDGETECDLVLYSNYRPWENETYTDGDKNVLINNVSLFKFAAYQNSMVLKICVQQQIGESGTIAPVTLCKEKAVIR